MTGLPAMPALFTEGAPSSPVRVLIFEDLQCPDCAGFRLMLDEKLLPRYGGKVTFEHRDFPLAKHAWARQAAIAARYLEDARPGAGVAYRRHCFDHLSEITADNFTDRLASFATGKGLDPGKAIASLADSRLAAQVEEDFQDGVARGIAHTPTILVNGHPFVEHFEFEDVAKAIDAELAAARY